jgi:hypothetical protein
LFHPITVFFGEASIHTSLRWRFSLARKGAACQIDGDSPKSNFPCAQPETTSKPVSGEAARIEHWVVAERQGQAVARSMLGIGGAYREAPFFWSQHYDVMISYVGRAAPERAVKLEAIWISTMLVPYIAGMGGRLPSRQ